MPKISTDEIERFDHIIMLLQQLVAIEFAKQGLNQADIGKRLGIAAGSVNKLIKGVNASK